MSTEASHPGVRLGHRGGPGAGAGRRRLLAVLAAVAALAVIAVIATAGSSGPQRVTAPVVRALGPASAGEQVRFTFLLRLPGAARMKQALAAEQDPHSPQFGHLIDPRSFGRRFGISAVSLARVEAVLRAGGVQVTASYPQRTALAVLGTVATVRRMLGVRIEQYGDSQGRRWHAPVGSPIVPAALSAFVSGVTGLDTRPKWHAQNVPMGGLTPETVPAAYDSAPLKSRGISGYGLRIAVISFSDYNHGDPAAFAARFGLTGPEAQIISVDGGTTDTSGARESNLDIDVIRAVAPQAQILFYEVPQSSSSYTDVINRIVADHSANIISSSWGQCELGLDPSQRAGDSLAISAAEAAGISMFVASGDAGAYDCQEGDLTDHRLSVDWPASSAGAIAVGGTRLDLHADGTYAGEGGWEDILSGRGGGGGVTTGDARPSWQAGPGVHNSYSNGRRQVPDVSADADPGTGWMTYSNASYGQAGGTSAAAPFWASSMLLVQQYAATQGVSKLGYVNPILYALAASRQPFPPFHDVTLGGNRYFQTTPGWDPATGLGSPDVYNLARDMDAYVRVHPAR
jgi:subtilase family serine protease